MKPKPTLITFKQCANCHERDLASEFTFNWCPACAEAFIKGAVTTFAALFGTWLISYVLYVAARLW